MKQKSFTLIELLVVIVIIGILAGVIVVSTSSAIQKANFAKAQAFSSTVRNELFSDLVSEWTFDEPEETGRITKDTGGNNDGTVTGATYQNKASGNCVYGGCYLFDGDDYIQADDVYCNSLNGMTWSVWVKFNEIKNCFILDQRESDIGYQPFYLNSGGDMQFYNTILKNNTYFYTNLETNQWYLLTATTENNLVKFYLNGSYFISKEDTSYDFGVKNLRFGSRYNDVSFLNGLIDDVRIYNVALSSAQIKQEYIAGLNSLLANGNITEEEYSQRIGVLASK